MKNCFALILLLVSSCLFSQQKYQSLLWEISGNGLEKSSYIYGTMHVSKKIAFRLDDVFYKALEKSECIALESDPTTWLDFNYENKMLSALDYIDDYSSNFYVDLFALSPPTEFMVRRSIRFDNDIINGYLYRKDMGSEDFEEETYLDMFIYQAGKKNNKPIIGLEDIAESNYLTTKAQSNPVKKKPDAWIQKLFSEENPYMLQENLYRERNLDLLDSIGSAVNTEYYRKNMLFIRNDNMVIVLDSLMHEKSVFAGVGAAHLPGDKGMINMLIEKGYTVKALKSDQTEFGNAQKQALETLFIKPELQMQSTPDGFLTIKAFDDLREFAVDGQKFYVAPDMTNGAYLTITRLNTFDYLPNKDRITLDKIDNLLYEDIPGDIIKKEKLTAPYPGFSILNKTKKGDYQKYHIYKTPLEFVIIKFGGIQDYVLLNEKEIFESLRFKEKADDFETFVAPYQKYSIELPKYHISDNLENSGKKVIQGFQNNEYYFLEESPVFDIDYIEEDEFEAKFVHEKFYGNLELKEETGQFVNDIYKSYESSTRTDSTSQNHLYLKSIVKDESYYLLGYYGEKHEKADDYFKSFQFKNIIYPEAEKVVDTSLYFTAYSQTKAPPNPYYGYGGVQKPYDRTAKSSTYTTKANEQITIARYKSHDLQMSKDIDSIWDDLEKNQKTVNSYKKEKNFKMTDLKKSKKDSTFSFSFTLKDTTSAKMILVKYVQKKGVMYEMRALTDSISQPSTFLTEFYESFEPMDTFLGKSVFVDKTAQFFDALQKNDSIVLNGYRGLIFTDKHTDDIINVLKTHEFSKIQNNIKLQLIRELSELKDPKINPYLNQLYLNSYSEPEIQSTILRAYLNRNSKQSYKTIMSLMENDLPLDVRNINSIFRVTNDSLQLTSELFPNILRFTSVEEYKEPIYTLLATVLDSNLVKAKIYRKYKSQIITDGKIELKRTLGSSTMNTYSSKHSNLDTYVKLIFLYREDKNGKEFFEKLTNSDNAEALTSYAVLLEKEQETIPKVVTEKTLIEPKNQWLLAKKLHDNDVLSDRFKKQLSQEQLAKSFILSELRFDEEKDTISFISKKEIITDEAKEVMVYFFKLQRENSYEDSKSLHYVAFLKPETEELAVDPFSNSSQYGNIMIDENMDKYIDEALDQIKHQSRKRVNGYMDDFDY
ncbi:MAG: TraB/GumN family protein [Aquaticitalea sp.]